MLDDDNIQRIKDSIDKFEEAVQPWGLPLTPRDNTSPSAKVFLPLIERTRNAPSKGDPLSPVPYHRSLDPFSRQERP